MIEVKDIPDDDSARPRTRSWSDEMYIVFSGVFSGCCDRLMFSLGIIFILFSDMVHVCPRFVENPSTW